MPAWRELAVRPPPFLGGGAPSQPPDRWLNDRSAQEIQPGTRLSPSGKQIGTRGVSHAWMRITLAP